MCIRIDSELKTQAESILSELGMNMSGTINMFLKQIVREKAVPLKLSLSSEETVRHDLAIARAERKAGINGYDAETVLREMDDILAVAEKGATYGKAQSSDCKQS